MMSLWDALRMNMMISYQELVRTFLNAHGVRPKTEASRSPSQDGKSGGGDGSRSRPAARFSRPH